ncbi:MAG: S-adenosylmethionine:tRNA ribosyltransferase-isomerase [Bacillota bacterium]|nr:S-adenosylmethionine:tRNA ribosyltransferase-isomerase [Bacillota bacterium]MDK2925714.1 S-adenosylmethionine:tRNA ribosyltransferase-isomerase [Bacillota bacterium]MDK2960005.1 S-adenosylmethionine:tRNA ribosyltransferase-isomerase [Bacillota bacterium]
MRLEEFDYELPPELIAQTPLDRRDESRLLVLERRSGKIEHRVFHDLPAYLRPGDVLVLNDTRVLPARLIGRRSRTGGKVEVLLLRELGSGQWETLVKPGRRCPEGEELVFGGGKLTGRVLSRTQEGGRVIAFSLHGPKFLETLNEIGKVPLPPYIHTELKDQERYQTVYARHLGSAAAPTAGLHFTPELLKSIEARGISILYLTLHVGLGTFRPVREERIEDHRMHEEYYVVRPEVAEAVNAAKKEGRRVVAVGTTVVRTLESAGRSGEVKAGADWTDLFIYPGFEFRIVDALVTNFHLPKSTLLMLVSAFAGREKILRAYQEAVKERYRFFSFGDAMLII